MLKPQDVDTEYVAEAFRREGEEIFYYHRIGEPQLFRTRESVILGIRQFLIAFGPDDAILEGYDIEAIVRELAHQVPIPRLCAYGESRWVYVIAADRETIEEVIVKHELSSEQLLDQISERAGEVKHAFRDSDEPLVLRTQRIDAELGKIIDLARQVGTHNPRASRR